MTSTVKLVSLKVSHQYHTWFQTVMVHNYSIHRCIHHILQHWKVMRLVDPGCDGRGWKWGSKVILTDSSHFSHLLPLEFPLSLVGARACAPLLCLSDCLCFCMCAWVSTWMQIYMCACVCSLFQRFCNLRESQTLVLEQPPGLGSV